MIREWDDNHIQVHIFPWWSCECPRREWWAPMIWSLYRDHVHIFMGKSQYSWWHHRGWILVWLVLSLRVDSKMVGGILTRKIPGGLVVSSNRNIPMICGPTLIWRCYSMEFIYRCCSNISICGRCILAFICKHCGLTFICRNCVLEFICRCCSITSICGYQNHHQNTNRSTVTKV